MGRKLTAGTVFWIFVCCIFMGITVGSIGIGALFPSANRITKHSSAITDSLSW